MQYILHILQRGLNTFWTLVWVLFLHPTIMFFPYGWSMLTSRGLYGSWMHCLQAIFSFLVLVVHVVGIDWHVDVFWVAGFLPTGVAGLLVVRADWVVLVLGFFGEWALLGWVTLQLVDLGGWSVWQVPAVFSCSLPPPALVCIWHTICWGCVDDIISTGFEFGGIG